MDIEHCLCGRHLCVRRVPVFTDRNASDPIREYGVESGFMKDDKFVMIYCDKRGTLLPIFVKDHETVNNTENICE